MNESEKKLFEHGNAVNIEYEKRLFEFGNTINIESIVVPSLNENEEGISIEQPPLKDFTFVHKLSRDFKGNNPHIHVGFFEIYIFLGGNATYYYVSEKCRLKPGNLIISPPGALHRADSEKDTDYERIVIHVSEKHLSKLSTEKTDLKAALLERSLKVYKIDQNMLSNIVTMIDRVGTECSRNEIAQDIITQSQIAILISQLLRICDKTKIEDTYTNLPELIKSIMNYIDVHLADKFSIQQMANDLNVSRSHLCHEFKRYYDASLWEYVIHRRLALSQKLLVEGHSVTEACFDAGFQNYSNYIKTFSKTFGITPHKYAVTNQHGTIYL